MDLSIVRVWSSQTATPSQPSNCIGDYRDAQGGSRATTLKRAQAN
jgi:hypothetical protein